MIDNVCQNAIYLRLWIIHGRHNDQSEAMVLQEHWTDTRVLTSNAGGNNGTTNVNIFDQFGASLQHRKLSCEWKYAGPDQADQWPIVREV